MKLKSPILAMVCSLLLLISCSTNEDVNLAEVKNIAAFDRADNFFATVERLEKMNDLEFELWERENSFKSYRSILAEAENEWVQIEREQDIPEFQKKYEDILSIQDGEIVPHIRVFSYQSIVNREGIYKTGNHFHKVIGDYIVTVPQNEYFKLREIKSVHKFSENNSVGRIFRYADTRVNDAEINGARVSATCTPGQYYKEAEYYNGASKCRDGRKAYISALSYMYLFTGYGDFNGTTRYGDFYQQAVMIQLWGKIRNWVCQWGDYSTQLEYRSVHYKTVAPIITGYESDRSLYTYSNFDVTVPDYNTDFDGGDKQLARQINKFGDVIFNNQPSYGSFLYIYAEGKSRGVGDNWAIIFCPQ